MKKVLCLFLIMILCISLVACGENDQENSTANLEIGTPVDLDEQIIYDDNDIIIKAKRLEFLENSADYCARYHYEVTNNSNSDIQIEHLTFDVNGVSIHTPSRTEVYKQGETLENYITLNQNCCEWNDIKVIKDISFNLKIETCHENPEYVDDYEVDSVIVEKTGNLTAKTKYADKYANYEQEIDKSGTVLVEDENVSLIFKDIYIEANTSDEKCLESHIYYRNDYDFPVKFSHTAVKINGEEIPNENNTVEIPLNSEGVRYWFEVGIDYEKIESMEFTYTITNDETDEVIMKIDTPVKLTFGK